jgi:hypothetical protein
VLQGGACGGDANADGDSGDAAQTGQEEGFGQELCPDVAGGGGYGAA